eukprot:TRINITY_DN6841_c0_g1_i6.p1 TRINITY_DN6841_c0_g1~~TRINITY_DN6841_c0_g1_i6.p1  ORF type:complete len:500 (-),score=106.57 TRINITY_DN6841_c0_g1_i6:49-1548(-)
MGQEPMPNQDHTPDFWTSVANMFKTAGNAYSNVILDPFNEPFPENNVWDSTQGWLCWRDGGNACRPWLWYTAAGMQSLVTTIRNTGATNIILLGGLSYSNSLKQWVAYKPVDPLNNLVAAVHIYPDTICSNVNCYDTVIKPVAAQYPVLISEIGQKDCGTNFVNALMDWCDTNAIGYMGWTWNTWDCGGGPSLISNYDGTPTNFGSALKTRFASFAGATLSTVVTSTSIAYATISSSAASSGPSSATTGAPPSGGSLYVYHDGLTSSFQDWSFADPSSYSLSSTTMVFPGTTMSISWTPNNWEALSFQCRTGGCIDTRTYTRIEFYIVGAGGSSGQQIVFNFIRYDGSNSHMIGQQMNVPVSGSWQKVSFDFSSWGFTTADGMWIKANSANPQQAVYIDEIVLTAPNTATGSLTTSSPAASVASSSANAAATFTTSMSSTNTTIMMSSSSTSVRPASTTTASTPSSISSAPRPSIGFSQLSLFMLYSTTSICMLLAISS